MRTPALLLKDHSKLSILLAQPQTFSLVTDRYFTSLSEAHEKHLTCSFDSADIVSVAPADYDGDGGMDVAVALREAGGGGKDKELRLTILWGEHDQNTGEHKLICPAKAAKEGIDVDIKMDAEPLVLDANGDQVADLFGQRKDTRCGTIAYVLQPMYAI